jgi:hypothetical protein
MTFHFSKFLSKQTFCAAPYDAVSVVGHKQREEDDTHGDRSEKCEEGAGVERSSSYDEVTGQFQGGEGPAAGVHYKRWSHRKVAAKYRQWLARTRAS